MPATEPSPNRTKPPANVQVVNEEPLVVELAGDEPPTPVKSADGTLSLPPTTTRQQDIISDEQADQHAKTTEGQRNINLIWENTQSRIALLVVIVGVLLNSAVVVLVVFFNREVTVTQLALISICLQFINLTVGIVIGFYFSRTNHQAVGGIGTKPESPYVGR